jgi:hypothetical protein
MAVNVFPVPSSGSIGGTLRETITSSTNNYSAPNSQVYVVVAGGGAVTTAGHVAFGYSPVMSRVVVGGASGTSVFGTISGIGAGTSNATLSALTYGMTGAGGFPSGGNSNLGYTGAAGQGSNPSWSPGSRGGGGGGAGIAGNANGGNGGSGYSGGNGGNGGLGGGAAGGGGHGAGPTAPGTGLNGTPGSGAILVYY